MGAIGDIFFRALFEDSQLTAEANRVGTKVGDTAGRSMGQRLTSGLARTIGGAAIGTTVAGGLQSSIVAFGKFEQRMNEVFTLLPDLTSKAMGQMTEDVKEFARETGNTTEDTIPALYNAISAGVPPENVFDFLRTANKAAVGGVTDINTAVGGLASVVNAYGSDVIDAARAGDIMFTTVKNGITTFPELSNALSNVTPIASSLGVSFEDVSAAIATLTKSKVPTSQATTQIRAALAELSKQGTKVDKIFRDIAGKSFAEFIASGGTMTDALMMIRDHGDKTGLAMTDMFGSIEAGGAALLLTANNGAELRTQFDNMSKGAGSVQTAFERMDSGVEASARKFAAKLETMALDVGGFISKFGPLPQIIASTFGPSMARAIGAGLGGLVGLVGPKLASALAGLLPTAIASGAAQGTAMGGAAAGTAIATQTAGVATGQAAVAAGAVGPAGVAGTAIGTSMGTAAGAAFKLFLGAAIVVGVALAAEEIHKAISREGGLAGRTKKGTTLFADELAWPFGPKNTPRVDIGPFKNIFGGDSAFTSSATAITQDMLAEHRAREQQDRSSGRSSPVNARGENEWTSGWTRGVDKLHDDLVKAIDAIKATDDPKALADALGAVLASILGGEGNAAQTTAVIAELEAKRTAALARGDTATATLFADAIARLEPFAKGRQWQAEQIDQAKKVVASNKSTADKVAALKGIQADLLSHQRTMAAGMIAEQIKTVQAIENLPANLKSVLGASLLRRGNKALEDANQDQPAPKPSAPKPTVPRWAPTHAFGGAVNALSPTWVGEHGIPELFVPRASGTIVPAADVPGMAGSNTTINVPIQGLIPYRDAMTIPNQLKRLGDFGVLTPRRSGT